MLVIPEQYATFMFVKLSKEQFSDVMFGLLLISSEFNELRYEVLNAPLNLLLLQYRERILDGIVASEVSWLFEQFSDCRLEGKL